VLNYFNGNGTGGGFPTERGANTAIEFERQRAKIINAIKELNADVVGLIELRTMEMELIQPSLIL
jgi:predicted extracellular nuclease